MKANVDTSTISAAAPGAASTCRPRQERSPGCGGWVKLHRSLLSHPRISDPEWLAVWVYLLLSATHQPRKVNFDGKIVELQSGQMVTGRLAIAAATGVHESKVKRLLQVMKRDQQIDQQAGVKSSIITVRNWQAYQNTDQQNDQRVTSNRPKRLLQVLKSDQQIDQQIDQQAGVKSSIITVRNWQAYQDTDQQNDQQNGQRVTSNRPASDQQLTTNKNGKKESTEDDIHTHTQRNGAVTLEAVKAEAAKANLPEGEAERFFAHYSETDWTHSNGKPIKDWRHALKTWTPKGSKRHSVSELSRNVSDTFERFWEAYPNKQAKPVALAAWNLLCREIAPEELLAKCLNALSWQTRSKQWTKDAGQFIPAPKTYLEKRRFEDEPTKGSRAPLTDEDHRGGW